MSQTAPPTLPSTPKPHKTYKFLRRSIPLKRPSTNLLKQVLLRRFHIKNIENHPSNEEDPFSKLNTHKYLKKSTLKTLQKAHIFYMRELNWLNDLKTAKNLKEIQVKINLDDVKAIPGFYQASLVIDKIFQCLKKFPKGIKSVSVQAEGLNIRKGHLNKIYRIIGSFRQIERVQRVFGVMRGQDLVKREYGLARRYMRRCRNLKRFEYNPFGYQDDGYWMGFEQMFHPFHAKEDQKSWMEMMKERKMFEFVTSLKLPVNTKYFKNYVHYERFLKELKDDQVSDSSSSSEEEEGNSSEDEERIDPGTQKMIQDRNRNMMKMRLERGLLLFFRFELFPNLKSLKIDMNKKSLYYFTNSIVKSFGLLLNLQDLEIALPKNPRESKFLYRALMKLPLLSKFGMIMSTMTKEEAGILLKFLEKQTNLVSLMLNNDWIHVEEKPYKIQEDLIRELGRHLAENKALKDLSLIFGGSSMKSLSFSLRELTAWKNQMRSLTLGFYDNTVCGSDTVEGLCGFLENQGESLKSLFLEFNFIVNADALGRICQGIMKLKELRSLEIYINEIGEPLKKTYIGFFKDTLKEKSPLALRPNVKGYKTWLVELARMLPKMENLEVLKLKVGRLTIFDEKFVREYLKVVESLRKIGRLRNLSINVPFEKLKKEEKEEMKKGLLRLENVRNLVVEPFVSEEEEENGRGGDNDDILEVVEMVNKRQEMKHGLMF